ncbi:hypothetical protein BS50DRAFT_582905 [Corynespora cassiicola Philippines]|uniref:histidine kinase n=1 Tax=Corynespora cassiicola Philippines TaxID=1448308 RepID=A0A2T2P708_CORCC|nr:hypothetical protein BS50DRAFT_582905 [Corynespora cassiicola Philippines]
MPDVRGQRVSFFPKADACVLHTKRSPPSPNSRPTEVSPILDVENAGKALDAWSEELTRSVYPDKTDIWAPAPIPDEPATCSPSRYLFPVLTRNERLRLTMLFYYTHGALEDEELMSRLQEKVYLAKDTVGWEFVIAGLLNHNTYTRMVTVGLPLAVLPRRESTCAHTVNQPPGTIFAMQNMLEDWRFRESPHVQYGGLRAYAGAPLRFETEFGDHVAFGSLCVASNAEQEQLSEEQQTSLAQLADWIVADIIQSARIRRQRDRRRLLELLGKAQESCDQDQNAEEFILEMLQDVYPSTTVNIQRSTERQISFGDQTQFPTSDLEHGLWEDGDYFDYMIEHQNHLDLVAPRVIRAIVAPCASQHEPTFLCVGSNDFRRVYDDVDSWFVHVCGTILCRYWQGLALKEALTAKSNFLRGITHQLRTPIHGILGSVELLAEELQARNVLNSTTASSPLLSPDIDKMDPYTYIKTIRTSARELISTVNSLIKLNQWADIAMAERATSLYRIDEIESELLRELVQVMPDDLLDRPSIIFSHCLPSNCDTLDVDIRLVIDCIQPLVINAAQNTPGGVVAVTLSISEDCQTLAVDVEDNGRGIDPDNQHRVFEAYEKVDRNTTEAGLGLTLACKAAALMQGRISLVSSAVQHGSHFRASFSEPPCACSYPLRRPLQEKFPHLPPTFHRIHCPSKITPLGKYLGRYLENNGFIESENPDGSFLVLEYTPDAVKLHSSLSLVHPQQVALCLVPDFDPFLDFDGQQFITEGNVIYVKGPFLSNKVYEALYRADKLLAEFEAAQPVTNGCKSSTGEPAEESYPTTIEPTTSTGAAEVHPPHPIPTLAPTLQADLARSLQSLNIKPTPPKPPPSITHHKKPTTLLVDDNVINLRLLEMYCTRRNIPFRTAKDGSQAVVLFTEHKKHLCLPGSAAAEPRPAPFNLVLMDLQMPVCDGIEATRQIRALEAENKWPRCVLLIVTGQDSVDDRRNAEEVGADGFLVKPVGPKVLDRWLEAYFGEGEGG